MLLTVGKVLSFRRLSTKVLKRDLLIVLSTKTIDFLRRDNVVK